MQPCLIGFPFAGIKKISVTKTSERQIYGKLIWPNVTLLDQI